MAEVVATALVGGGVLALTKRSVVRRLRQAARRTSTQLDDLVADLVEKTHGLTLLALATAAAMAAWGVAGSASGLTHTAGLLVGAVQVGVWGDHIVAAVARDRFARTRASEHPMDTTAWSVMVLAARAALWALVVLVVLDTLGIDVTALVAGLGIGGLAVGLALQNVLGDVFASLSIVFDRPFVVGDFLAVDEVTGTVEHIGIKTTRVRALSGEQIVISNAELLKARIRNFQRLSERRNVVTLGVLYETPSELLAQIPAVMREVVEAIPATRFDRAHLCRFGESSVDFELAYFLADADYNRHMDVQQSVLLALLARFSAMGVGFAYPTRTLHVSPTAALSVDKYYDLKSISPSGT